MSLLGFWDLRVPSSVLAFGKANAFSKVLDQDMESRGGVKTPVQLKSSSTVIDLGSLDPDRPLVGWKGSLLSVL